MAETTCQISMSLSALCSCKEAYHFMLCSLACDHVRTRCRETYVLSNCRAREPASSICPRTAGHGWSLALVPGRSETRLISAADQYTYLELDMPCQLSRRDQIQERRVDGRIWALLRVCVSDPGELLSCRDMPCILSIWVGINPFDAADAANRRSFHTSPSHTLRPRNRRRVSLSYVSVGM